ncbi:MAG: hypothetical protein Kow0031_34040 [Anaerolineae bacterium]
MAVNANPGSYVEVDPGIELYYEERGSGQPIIFIPGWTFTTEVFQHQLEHFGQSHRAITFDPRSHGRSTTTPHVNDYTTHGDDLAKLIAALELKDVVLVGWSFGCLNSWAYVRQAGLDNVKAVVSVDLSPKPLSTEPGDWVEGPLDEIAGAYNAFLRSPKGQRDFVEYYATQVMIQEQVEPAQLFWVIEQSLKTPYYVAAQLFASGMFSNYLEEAQLVDANVPALTICAEHWAETAVAFTNKHCPNTQTAVLGGHMMFWEHPAKFNQILDDFLAGR